MSKKSVYVSHTSKETYLTCPRKYYLHYKEKIREITQSSALSYGKAVDEGLNVLLLRKDDPDVVNKAKNAFYDEWNKILDNDMVGIRFSKSDLDESILSDEELLESKDDNAYRSWLSLKNKGDLFIEAYYEQIIPRIKRVIDIQKQVKITNEDGDVLTGFIDLVCEWEDGRIIVFDNKTTSVTYKEDSVRTSEQLATYYEASLNMYDKVDACGYIVISKAIRKRKLPKVKIDVIIDNIPDKLTMKTFNDYDKVLEGIKSEKFEENRTGCTTKYGKCQFYEYCRSGSMEGLKK